LIVGETGTGKELVARALHDSSHRAARPMISVNCSAIPSELLESLLFGHERGAFTGADRRRRGRMEVAEDGTILLDEIGDMPMPLQAKLLRVLEDKRFLPVGAEKDIELRARIVASTNIDLAGAVAAGTFRKDLFYRLNVIEIRLPNLAERGDADFLQLLEHLIERAPRPLSISYDAKLWLAHQHWDGNIRQVKNAIERLCLLAPSDSIDIALLEELLGPPPNGEPLSLHAVVDDILSMVDIAGPKISVVEKLLIDRAMERSGGNKTSAAKLLGIHRKALERRMERMSQPPAGDDE
jgi:transcriptional regulator with PAS, ATPase and Fis domain